MKNYGRYSYLCLILLLAACKNDNAGSGGTPSVVTNNDEMTQQVGDAMASVDESGGDSGNLAFAPTHIERSLRRTFQRWAPAEIQTPHSFGLIAQAFAATCTTSATFSSCTNNVIERTLENCTIGGATLIGGITLTFEDDFVNNTCQLTAEGHSVARDPNFTATGLRGAALNVRKTGSIGQKITRTATYGEFLFTNDGIRRTFTGPAATVLFDFSTQTLDGHPITVTGTYRLNRQMNGGVLQITNELTGVSCGMTPTDVTWTDQCRCAASGSWTGTCTDNDSVTVEITGCGQATMTKGDRTQSVDFDRCERI